MFGGDDLARYNYNVLDDMAAVKAGGSRDYSYFCNAGIGPTIRLEGGRIIIEEWRTRKGRHCRAKE